MNNSFGEGAMLMVGMLSISMGYGLEPPLLTQIKFNPNMDK